MQFDKEAGTRVQEFKLGVIYTFPIQLPSPAAEESVFSFASGAENTNSSDPKVAFTELRMILFSFTCVCFQSKVALWKCWFYLYNRSEFNFRYTSFKRWITPPSLHFCKIIYAWMSWKYFNYPSWLNYFLYLNTKEQRITSSNTDNVSVFTQFAQRTHK